MPKHALDKETTEFVILSFEGPDSYSLAGGLGVRTSHLCRTLATRGFRTHLFFVGDPHLPGEECAHSDRLVLHRWCQWISTYFPDGVYHGEEDKLRDYTRSVPGFVTDHVVRPAVAQGKAVVVLAEEWQTAEAMCRLGEQLRSDSLREHVLMFWNANNTYSFDRIDWARLNREVRITTVSRYMKDAMKGAGVNPLVIPNGIPDSLLHHVDTRKVRRVQQALRGDPLLCKVARGDPEKGWLEAVAATARLRGTTQRALLLARGGIEPYGAEVMRKAVSTGLAVRPALPDSGSHNGHPAALQRAVPSDIIDIRFHLPQQFLRLLCRTADAVLANSSHEPFGLVGLEAMAAGGIVFAGSTGEDYAVPFVNSFVLETGDPEEIVTYITYLKRHPEEEARMRRAARQWARYFTWNAAVDNLIAKAENQARLQGILQRDERLGHLHATAPAPDNGSKMSWPSVRQPVYALA